MDINFKRSDTAEKDSYEIILHTRLKIVLSPPVKPLLLSYVCYKQLINRYALHLRIN